MHTNDLHDKFIELRAQGLSLRKIAEQLGVHRNTILEWDGKYRELIDSLRAFELEAIRERVVPGYEQQLTALAEEYERITHELRTRELRYAPTAYLAGRQFALLSRLDKMQIKPRSTPPKPNPDPNPGPNPTT
jgi:transposase